MNSNLIVALDAPNAGAALELAEKLVGLPVWVKIGLELYTAEGPSIVHKIKDMGFTVFLDLKFHDIPNTVYGAVKAATKLGVRLLTIHLSGGEEMIKAAVEGRREAVKELFMERRILTPPFLLGITALTSDKPAGTQAELEKMVVDKAKWAMSLDIEGVVCSGLEAAAVKEACGKRFLCLCPGIRFPGAAGGDDQSRIVSPAEAVLAGADFLVMGRPITKAEDPRVAAELAVSQMGTEASA